MTVMRRDLAGVFVDGRERFEVCFNTPAWAAAMEWARFHGLDPMMIPAGSVIERDGPARQIRYQSFVPTGPGPTEIQFRGDFDPVIVHQVEKGEGILPLPPEVTG